MPVVCPPHPLFEDPVGKLAPARRELHRECRCRHSAQRELINMYTPEIGDIPEGQMRYAAARKPSSQLIILCVA